ncbi:GDP-mannose 6-dehydrogenase [Bryocella elongata]|uniref:UDP-glucose 6-dehydrogenase n=1 Tax=Bryocella elongata TaxID=863522 RepID=A0A1H5XZD4_9BACT|nr:nucleotide sugar dehydrogenase [Bryocella elongata]SEG17038.1 GDP-mannose 6-dehydrogenase [Bryocella elongata]
MGLGYVGCVSSACLAEIGHNVLGVDRDQHKIEMIAQGQSPFYEPGLTELVQRNVEAKRLRAGALTREAVAEADVMLLCVGTPSQVNGNIDLGQLHRVAAEIADLVGERSKPLVIAVRSTVFPGTCEALLSSVFSDKPSVHLVSNPEFLREGAAVKDFMEPSLLVVGGTSDVASAIVAGLYSALPVEAEIVSLRTAEMIKYTCNAYHAVKVGFANEIGSLASALGVDPMQVMATMCKDTKLNTSAAYMKPGFAFGGSCLPKDLRALTFRASRLDVKLPLLESVLPSNDEHLRRGIRAVLALPGKRVGIFGLAFKEDTDDLRESPIIALVEFLLGKGRETRIYDPHIRLEAIYGSNLSFVVSALPHIGRLMVKSVEELLTDTDAIVIAQKPSAAMLATLQASGKPTLDLTKLAAMEQNEA